MERHIRKQCDKNLVTPAEEYSLQHNWFEADERLQAFMELAEGAIIG